MDNFPTVQVEATFFNVICNGVDLGIFSAFEIHQAFADDVVSTFEFTEIED